MNTLKSTETMIRDGLPKEPVESIDWSTLAPTYPYRFNGPAYLYCVGCLHFIRLALRSTTEALCADCGRVFAVSVPSN